MDEKLEVLIDQVGRLTEGLTEFRSDMRDIKNSIRELTETNRQVAETTRQQAETTANLVRIVDRLLDERS
ncbi:MAG: hypothetical protein ACFE0J_24835 [Elainellaceae cyanobacterium]